jgi:mRNA-degrading endonuclease RelE of RelBE toxin-antitoxin system
MTYVLEFKPRALKDLEGIPEQDGRRIFAKMRIWPTISPAT